MIENAKRYFWCPDCVVRRGVDWRDTLTMGPCTRHARLRMKRRLARAVMAGGALVVALLLWSALAQGATAEDDAAQNQVILVETGPLELWEQGEWGRWLQEIVGLTPRRGRWGMLNYGGFDEPGRTRGAMHGAILNRKGVRLCEITGWWTWADGTLCLDLSATCGGLVTTGVPVCG